jgi:hypothetical protein
MRTTTFQKIPTADLTGVAAAIRLLKNPPRGEHPPIEK